MGVRHGPLRRHADILARDLHRERFGAQARAMACLARMRRLIFAQPLAHPRAFGLEQAAIEVADHALERRSEEHTSELQSLMRTSYAVFCLKKNQIKSTACT